MQEQPEQPDAGAEPAGDASAAGAEDEQTAASAEDEQVASAVDDQASQSAGAAAEEEPEVPGDARDTIARAEQHLQGVDMDEQRKSVEQTQKDM